MVDVKHCDGCRDDFYNGKNQYGVKRCWMLEKAELAPRLLIHVDQAPPYLRTKPVQVPTCYKKDRHVTVKTDAIGADGYWAR